ncbi:MAG TPA: TrmH family RNA methyltransferase [Solirubrobacteraceae bacterium]
MGGEPQIIEAARRDPQLVVLEGFHAVKHALRFGAQVSGVFADDPAAVAGLAADLAPDLVADFAARTVPLSAAELGRVAPGVPTGVVGIARRPRVDVEALLARPAGTPVVLLEDPRNLGNIGAVIRVAAAAAAAGVVTTGRADPWDSSALRGSAGLHFAIPVARIETLVSRRPLIGLDPDGDPLVPRALPGDAVLAFGSERTGLSRELLERCDARLALPMRAGVSSLNLATAVAAVLFAWRLASGWSGAPAG